VLHLQAAVAQLELGTAVQAASTKPVSNAPGTKRLKPRYDEPLSKLGLNELALLQLDKEEEEGAIATARSDFSVREVGRCTLTRVVTSVECARCQRLKRTYDEPFSSIAFNLNLRCYSEEELAEIETQFEVRNRRLSDAVGKEQSTQEELRRELVAVRTMLEEEQDAAGLSTRPSLGLALSDHVLWLQ